MPNVIDYDRLFRVNVIDSRGPQRTIVSVDEQTDGTLVTNSCGHVERCNQIFQYKIGSSHTCFSCRYAPDNVISQEPLESDIVEQLEEERGGETDAH